MGDNFAPSFTQKPKLSQEDDGNKLIFNCQLTAHPAPDIEWSRGDERVKESRRCRMIVEENDGENLHDVQLTLDDVQEADAGLYKVKAKNKFGEVSASINLNFNPDQGKPGKKQIDGTAPTFTQKPVIKQEDGGKHIRFECRILAEPKPVIHWYRDGAKVQESQRCKVVIEKEEKAYLVAMNLKNVTVEDAGKYKVTAKNQLGESNANISLNFDKGKVIPEGFAPTFLDKPSIIPNESGTMITMKVRCKAKPQPNVEWIKNGLRVEVDNRLVVKEHKVTEEMFEFSCIVKKPQPTDGGAYKCYIRNMFGELNANLNLNIEVAPTIKRPPRIVSIVNRTVTIECLVMSTSQPACHWFKDASKVQMDLRHCVTVTESSEGGYMCQLEILNVETSDCGNYKLVAKNEKGETVSNTVALTKDMIEEVCLFFIKMLKIDI